MRWPWRRAAGSLVCALVLSGVPTVVTVGVPAPSHAAICEEDSVDDCADGACPPESPECAAPPPPAPVVVPGPARRPDVDVCVNLGGRRRVGVSGCI